MGHPVDAEVAVQHHGAVELLRGLAGGDGGAVDGVGVGALGGGGHEILFRERGLFREGGEVRGEVGEEEGVCGTGGYGGGGDVAKEYGASGLLEGGGGRICGRGFVWWRRRGGG